MLTTTERDRTTAEPLMARCDRCGARALVRATKDGRVLAFCGHHGRAHTLALIAQGFTVDDTRLADAMRICPASDA